MHVKDLASLKIEGRCFSTPTVLKVFQGKSQRISFVFGRNGTGKSTISTAVREASAGALPDGINCLNYLNFDDAVLADEADVLESTFVFNESFIEDNVRISENGLHAIVMIGETGDISEKLDDVNERLQTINSELEEASHSLAEMNDSNNPLSPRYHRNKIYPTLSSLGGWGDREKEIRSLKRAASVTDSVQNAIVQLQLPAESKEQLENDYRQAIADLGQLNESEELQGVPVLENWIFEIDEEAIASELRRIVEHPNLTKRDKHILSLVEREGSDVLSESKEYFEIESNSVCPFCFRDITSDEKAILFESISVLLNEEADKHSKDLLALQIPEFDLDLTAFVGLCPEDVEAAGVLTKSIQDRIALLNSNIELKRNNLYTPIHIEEQPLQGLIEQLNSILQSIDEARKSWNKAIRNKRQAIDALQTLNKKIARWEIDQHLSEAKKANDRKTQQDNLVLTLEKQANDLTAEKNELESQKSSINIALDAINKSLAFIFLSKDRLVLSGEHGEYTLYSRGKKVRPCDVSAGERNAIALCYFFTLIGSGKSAEEKYSDPVFVLIDDPISSLDQDNRIGILSYIRHQLMEIVGGNKYSKVAVFTHDGYCMNAFEKMRKELVNRSIDAGQGFKIPYPALLELTNNSLIEWKLDTMRYTELIGLMYDYSLSPDEIQRRTIGNTSRKALEAFSTFEFSMGLSEFADSGEVLESIHDEKLKSYFDRLMFSIVLHSESHTADPVKIEGIVETAREYSATEIDRIVRDSLLLLYCINRNHVLTHLKDKTGAQAQLDSWIEEIKEAQ